MSQQTSTTSGLLAKIAGGDEAEFQRLYEATSGAAYSLALRIVAGQPAATEACEMAYAELWKQAATLAGTVGDVQGWLLGEVRRCALTLSRAAPRQSDGAIPSYEMSNTIAGEAGSRDGSRASDVAILDSLEGLPRRSLELAYFGGLTVEAIAEILSEPVAGVRVALREGMLKLATMTRTGQAP